MTRSNAVVGTLAPPEQAERPTEAEAREFRAALEGHLSGNLPKLVECLRKIEPASLNNPEASALRAGRRKRSMRLELSRNGSRTP